MHKFAGLTKPGGISKVGNWFKSVVGLKDDYLNPDALKQTDEYKACTADHKAPFKDYQELFDV